MNVCPLGTKLPAAELRVRLASATGHEAFKNILEAAELRKASFIEEGVSAVGSGIFPVLLERGAFDTIDVDLTTVEADALFLIAENFVGGGYLLEDLFGFVVAGILTSFSAVIGYWVAQKFSSGT